MLTRVTDPRAFGVAELDDSRARSSALRRSRSSRRATWPWSASTCSPRPSTRRWPASSPRGGASSRSPRRSSGSSTTGKPVQLHHHHRVLEGHRQRRRHARGQPAGARDRRAPARRHRRRRVRDHRPGRRRGGRAGDRLAHRRPGHHRRGHQGHRLLRRPVHRDRARTARSTTARSSTRSCCDGASIRGVRRIEASLIGHDAEVTPAPRVPKAHRLVLGDHSKVQISS